MRAVFALLVFLSAVSASAAPARPQVILVVADHLRLDDITGLGMAGLGQPRGWGRLALMSPGVAHGADPVLNCFASLGAGDSIAAGTVSEGRMDMALRQSGLRAALIGDADGDDTGIYRPARALLPWPDMTADPTVLDSLAPGGRRIDPARLWAETQAALTACDLAVADDGDFDRLQREEAAGDLAPAADALHRRQALAALSRFLKNAASRLRPSQSLLLVVPAPSMDARGHWNELTPLLFFGAGSGTLTSDTTQTSGLVAARDVAPTVLGLLHVPVPIQMTGAAMRTSAGSVATLTQMARQTLLNQQAQNPVFWGIGLAAPALIFPLLAAFRWGRMRPGTRLCRFAGYIVRLLAAWPLALLLAPAVGAHSLPIYVGVIAGLTAALAALLPSTSVILILTAVAVVVDGLLGSRLAAQSVLSSYALAGIRFYGIGNEYMGLLLGGSLLLAAGVWGKKRGPLFAVSWFALAVLVLSCPAFGSKAGGAVTATALFVLAERRLRGKKITIPALAAGIVGGFVLVFLWALAGPVLHLRHTHLASAVGAVGAGRFGYIAGIALRKIALAARVFLHPGTLLGIVALALILSAARTLFRQDIEEFYARRPRLAAASDAGLWGCGICVVFNDSGIVAAILLMMCLILPALDGLFETECASLPWMSAMSESASPSVMN